MAEANAQMVSLMLHVLRLAVAHEATSAGRVLHRHPNGRLHEPQQICYEYVTTESWIHSTVRGNCEQQLAGPMLY